MSIKPETVETPIKEQSQTNLMMSFDSIVSTNNSPDVISRKSELKGMSKISESNNAMSQKKLIGPRQEHQQLPSIASQEDLLPE